MLVDAGHGANGLRLANILAHEHRQDQLGRVNAVLADQGAHGRGGAQAARAQRGNGGRCDAVAG